jgi:8-oxo-dGTP pyrophosphatase MutT (NUDIX family)
MSHSQPDLSLDGIARIVAAYRPVRCAIPGLKPASVLLPLFSSPTDGSTRLWLLERTQDGSVHSGQVALPGGKPIPEDVDARATALREAWEELGIPTADVRVLGQLDDYATITGFKMTPVVGWIPSTFAPNPNPREVARHFEAPLSLFLTSGSRNWVQWASFRRLVQSYPVGDAIVWGATAAILRKFGELLLAASHDHSTAPG